MIFLFELFSQFKYCFRQYKFGEHRSNAEQLIKKIPVIYVPAKVAVCDGGGGALGHPLQYIQVQGMKPGEFNSCKYCGLRYAMAEGHHGH
jgi:NADH dehydrogenase (ubiquinone) Fe-S protein 6